MIGIASESGKGSVFAYFMQTCRATPPLDGGEDGAVDNNASPRLPVRTRPSLRGAAAD